MNDEANLVGIETDMFIFEAPAGYQIISLDDEAELVGPNDEFLVVSSYHLEDNYDEKQLEEFAKNIEIAMIAAADEPDLLVSAQLNKVVADNGLPIWSLLSEAADHSHFFDQYAVIRNEIAIVITIEGDISDRASSAEVEEAAHGLEFK